MTTTTEPKRVLWLNPLTGGTELVPEAMALDKTDCEILRRRWRALDEIVEPRVGDFVRFADGTERRFAHDWDECGLQTDDDRYPTSYYLGEHGCSYSGALFPCVPRESLTLTQERKDGAIWFFHHDYQTTGGGVVASAPFRVYTSSVSPAD